MNKVFFSSGHRRLRSSSPNQEASVQTGEASAMEPGIMQNYKGGLPRLYGMGSCASLATGDWGQGALQGAAGTGSAK